VPALIGALLLAAASPGGDPTALAQRAGEACRAGELEAAAESLRALASALDTALGPGHPATDLVRVNLAAVERAAGRAPEAHAAPPTGAAAPRAALDPGLEQALRSLRACSALAPAAAPKPAPEAAVGFEAELELARGLLQRGRYRRALEMAEDARAALGPDAPPAARMQLEETLALARLQLGEREAALAAARAAEALARELGATDLRITLARLRAQTGDLEGAGDALDALEPAARTPALRAELAEARGELALRLGSPRDALAELDPAVHGHREVYGAEHASTAAVLQLRGDAYRQAGDFPAADSDYRAALAARRRLGAAHPDVARTSNAIGVLRGDLGDWEGADRAFAEALAILEPALGAEHPETLTVRANRALARWGRAKSDAAAAEYAAVVQALAAALGEDHPDVAAALRNQARIEEDRGDLPRAGALLERALAAQRKSLGAEHPGLAPTRLARARLLARRGEAAAAAAEAAAATAALERSLGAAHPLVARARTLEARLAAARGDGAAAWADAAQASREIARYTRRTFGAISDRQRALLADDAEDVIGALLSAEGAPPRDVLLELLPHRDAVLRSIAAARRSTRGASGGELAELRRRYVAAVVGAGADAARRARELADEIDRLETRSSADLRLPETDPRDALERACERLPEDAALVLFAAYDRTARGEPAAAQPALAAFVVRRECKVARVDLPASERIEAAADAFAQAMRAQRADDPRARAALAEALLAPLAPPLAGARRWLVVPDGALWGVPIGALPDPAKPGAYLLERVAIGYLTSIFELAEPRPRRAVRVADAHSLLLGAPEFGSDGGPTVLTETGPCSIPPFDALPATQHEVEDIRPLVGESNLLLGADANKDRLAALLGEGPWLVHLATHAYFAGQGGCREHAEPERAWHEADAPIAPNPLLLSGIAMAGANEGDRIAPEARGGILTAYEVASLDLRQAGLVVLSACDTGTGLRQRGQEVQGLRWGFRAAGARALVTSLWLSNDVATRELMRAFYAALAEEADPEDPFRGAEALRRAQLAQIEAERRFGLVRPLVWANFVFSGVL
jgi:CHAT domain-containing protein